MSTTKSSTNEYGLSTTVDRFENRMAVLILADGQKINWPIEKLPEDAKEGSVLRLSISSAKSQEEERKKLAKELINELLKGE